MVFPVVMSGCESWTVKKAECWKIDAFELWCWRRLLRVRWTARTSNQSILKEISPGCSLEGLMLKLKLQYSGHLMRRVDSLEKTLMGAGGEGDDRGWDGLMTSLTWCTWVCVNSGSWWWTRRPRSAVIHAVAKSRIRLSNWTELNSELTRLWKNHTLALFFKVILSERIYWGPTSRNQILIWSLSSIWVLIWESFTKWG